MTALETKNFMEKIKVYFPNCNITDPLIIDEWTDRLSHVKIEDAYMKLDFHLTGQYKNEVPKLHYFTGGSKPDWVKEKKEEINGKITCKFCDEECFYSEFYKHEDKCRSIEYISKMRLKYLNTETDKWELRFICDERFEEKYNNLLNLLYNMEIEEFDKKMIGNALGITNDLSVLEKLNERI